MWWRLALPPLLLLLCAFDAATATPGAVAYTVAIGSPIQGSPWVNPATDAVFVNTIEPGNTIAQIDGATGALVWQLAFPAGRSGMRDSPVVDSDALLHLGDDNGTFFALNVSSVAARAPTLADVAWQFQSPADRVPGALCPGVLRVRPCEIYSSATLVDGVRFQGCEDNTTRAFVARTGAVLWTHTAAGHVDGTPAYCPASDTVVVGANDGFLYNLDARTGGEVWKVAHCGYMQQKPVFLEVGDRVWVLFSCYVPGKNVSEGGVYAVNMANGELVWQITGAGGVPAVGHLQQTEILLVAGYDGTVARVNAWTGEVVWQVMSPGAGEFMGPMVIDESRTLVYGGNMAGHVFALNTTTGDLVWSLQVDDMVISPLGPMPSADWSKLYFGTFAGTFYALDLE